VVGKEAMAPAVACGTPGFIMRSTAFATVGVDRERAAAVAGIAMIGLLSMQ